MKARRLTALVGKEWIQILRDPSTILIAFVLPVALLVIFGYGVSLDVDDVPIGVVVQDDGADALRLASAYQHSTLFEVRMARSVQPLEEMLVAGRIRGIVVIPSDFSAARMRGGVAPIQIITDGSVPSLAAQLASYAEGVRANWAAAEAGPSPSPGAGLPQVEPRFWFNPGLTSRYFLVPGSIAIVMSMIGTLLTALVIAREWERGTIEGLFATPASMAEFIASKLIPYFFLGMGSLAVCTVLAIFLFDVPFRGSVFALMAISIAFLIPALGQGLLISSVTKNQFVASQVALLTGFLPTFLLSGYLFEISSMPGWIQAITYFVPARYFIPPLQTVFVVGDVWALFLPNIAALIGFGVLFSALTFRATKRSLD